MSQQPAPQRHALDHLVYATPDLDATVAELEAKLGVRAAAGGQHPGLGTRNALLSLGPRTYLEIVGPDPDQPAPDGPRWFRIDELLEPTLVTWCAAATDLHALRARAVAEGIPLGEVREGGRVRPDGVRLDWAVTSPFVEVEQGVVPFFIEWKSSAHPAVGAPGGVRLVEFGVETPEVGEMERVFGVLGVGVSVRAGEGRRLVAVLEGRDGRVPLG